MTILEKRGILIESEPTKEIQRIDSLDVLRGFSLLGILLLNILGFGFVQAAYTAPALTIHSSADLFAWLVVELTAEGAMRALFSMLFGAGVVLFLSRDVSGRSLLHWKRNFWLLIFGLINGYVLLWTGDILVTYALCGFLLYFARNVSGKKLLIASGVLIVLLTLYNTAMHFGLAYMQGLAGEAALLKEQGEPLTDELVGMQAGWLEFKSQALPAATVIAEEVALRGGSYQSAFEWTLEQNTEILLANIWFILLPDALTVMLLGMALYKLGVLQGQLDQSVYRNMAVFGFAVGLTINAYEIWLAYSSGFEILASFSAIGPTYHLGRIALALGWVGLIVLVHRNFNFGARLAATGRMALSNYLLHSLICLFIFTGAGLGWINQMARWEVYGLVLVIWVLQLSLSPWWLKRYHFGPVEWIWRALTYSNAPRFKR